MKRKSKSPRAPTFPGPPRGRPFEKGDPRINRSGRPKTDPEVLAALQLGNMQALRRLWKLMHSSNERISLTATLGWLLKTVPNAEKLELTGAGGGPVQIEAVRARLADRLVKLVEARKAAAAPAEPEVKTLPEGE